MIYNIFILYYAILFSVLFPHVSNITTLYTANTATMFRYNFSDDDARKKRLLSRSVVHTLSDTHKKQKSRIMACPELAPFHLSSGAIWALK